MREEIEFEVAVNDVANVVLANSTLRPDWLLDGYAIDTKDWAITLYQPNDASVRITLRREVTP